MQVLQKQGIVLRALGDSVEHYLAICSRTGKRNDRLGGCGAATGQWIAVGAGFTRADHCRHPLDHCRCEGVLQSTRLGVDVRPVHAEHLEKPTFQEVVATQQVLGQLPAALRQIGAPYLWHKQSDPGQPCDGGRDGRCRDARPLGQLDPGDPSPAFAEKIDRLDVLLDRRRGLRRSLPPASGTGHLSTPCALLPLCLNRLCPRAASLLHRARATEQPLLDLATRPLWKSGQQQVQSQRYHHEACHQRGGRINAAAEPLMQDGQEPPCHEAKGQ